MRTIFCITGLLFAGTLTAQVAQSADLFQILKARDSLLFTVGFNTCDIHQFEQVVHPDFEFYHDQAGITATKSAFIDGIRDGLCKLNYRPRRELVESSLVVYPLKKNGILYGAIQQGEHRFYAVRPDQPDRLTSVAQFIHVWLLTGGDWKLSRGFSYDHQETETDAGGQTELPDPGVRQQQKEQPF
ncbi:MAG: nuclear transport factor 2 family protein [Bacteroidetes bacterium]|nr:nuclear transport factor 2 family protein [Bacteroidota bacterium]